ncbi:MAG TPA: terpene cyclase/mutase family protein [Chloroflexi bacterium]|jgi:hypothetical protein|nr:terpene cyclase/mutase family protein [Chloroflexota bacterium]
MPHRRRHIVTIAMLVVALLLGPLGTAVAQAPTDAAPHDAIAGALDWLRTQQAADGSFGGSVATTLEAALAIAAAGEDPSSWQTADGRPISDYLLAEAGQYAVDAASAGKAVTGLTAIGLDPRDANGIDLVARLQSHGDGEGVFGDTALAQSWAILGLAATQSAIPEGAASALIALQQEDGGWEGSPGWGTDSNTSALAIQALVAAGTPSTHPALTKAKEYLRAQCAPAGGFVYSSAWGDAADANSTAYGILGLLALGEDPAAAEWTQSGQAPWDALRAFQLTEGALEWQTGEGANLLATAQAVPALARATLPIVAAPQPTTLLSGQAIADTLVGRRAGAQTLYRLTHPGGGREVTVEVSTPAAHPLMLVGFGFNVYAADGQRIGGGSVQATSPQHVLRFAAVGDAGATWTVQVYNYVEGTPVPYTITATGMEVTPEGAPSDAAADEAASDAAAPAEEPADQPEPEEERTLEDEVVGTLVGERGGAYYRYELAVAEGEALTVRLRFSPDDPVTAAGLGFTIYTPSGRAVSAATTGVPGERVAHIAAATAGTYIVQVHNYISGVTMDYTLSR